MCVRWTDEMATTATSDFVSPWTEFGPMEKDNIQYYYFHKSRNLVFDNYVKNNTLIDDFISMNMWRNNPNPHIFFQYYGVLQSPTRKKNQMYSALGVICAFVCQSSRRMPGGGGSRSPTDTINLFDYRPTPRPPQQSRRTTSVPPPVVTPSPVGTLNVWPACACSIVECLRRVRSPV
ncbi:hypothetical protein QTP88_012073 [Uroleucon formosanum]